ncbi:MAG: hypothetical protein U0237_18170 [Thermoleophilia bacterium]
MRTPLLLALAAVAAAAVPAAAAPSDHRVACLTARGDVGRVAPAACRMLGLGLGDLGDFNLRNLRWTGWGTATARATGVVRTIPFEGDVVTTTPARVVLFRQRAGCGGRRWYTRARVSLRGGVPLQLRLPTCPGPRT